MLADCTRNYTVVQGDICDWISKSQNVSTYQLAAVNVGIIDATCSNLEPGQNLCKFIYIRWKYKETNSSAKALEPPAKTALRRKDSCWAWRFVKILTIPIAM